MKTKVSVKNICFILLFLLAPIMPEYFALFGHPFQTYLLALVLLITVVYSFARRRIKVRNDSIAIILFLYAIVISAANLISGKSILVCLFLIVKFVVPVVATLFFVKTEDDIEKAINYLLIGSAFVIVISFTEIGGFNVFSILENADLRGMGTRAQTRMGLLRLEGPFGQAIPYAVYITFIAALVQYKLLTTKKKIYEIYLVVLCIAEFLTLSRAPIVVFIVMQVAFLLYYNTKKRIQTIGKILIGLLLGVFFLVLIQVDVQGIWDKISTLFLSLTSNSANRELDFGDNYNPYLYRFALFDRVFEHMRSNNISFAFGDYYWENTFSIDNGYLAFLIFNGVVGLTGRLLLYIFAVIESWRVFRARKREHCSTKALSYALGVALIGYLINLTSVAQMGEATTLLVIIGLTLANARTNMSSKRKVICLQN